MPIYPAAPRGRDTCKQPKLHTRKELGEEVGLQVVAAPSCTVIKFLTIFFHPINQDSFLVFWGTILLLLVIHQFNLFLFTPCPTASGQPVHFQKHNHSQCNSRGRLTEPWMKNNNKKKTLGTASSAALALLKRTKTTYLGYCIFTFHLWEPSLMYLGEVEMLYITISFPRVL